MDKYFTAEELYEIKTSIGERLEKKEALLNKLKAFENKDNEFFELIQSNESDISDLKSALEKIKAL